ncbi:MAG TPA: class II aldolase/adducin family protein [Phenylobacterium sp.]|uniref:class II aldolase/adducin family protein n=1 Tax=Phenylobacterium sp. TaxID=1871053 RepID=UPI002B4A8115|nr:class II aldolase/adducin family protein [Phenylobacterium sp.]HKR90277.1 class II aldolase/adducin family protein [Phenylobacterium sp.]
MPSLTMYRDKSGNSPKPISAAEWNLRLDLAAAYRAAALFGWDDMIGTHFTARVPGADDEPEAFLINPYGQMFEEITASSLVKVDTEGNILSDTDWPVNKAGFVVHSAVHRVRHDAGCVMHLHTKDGVAVSALEDGLLPLNQTALIVRGKIGVHEYEGPAVSLEERERMAAALGDRDLMFLRNHGTMAVGATVAEAFQKMYLLECACTYQVRTLAMGLPWHRPDQKVIDETDANYGHRDPHIEHYVRDLFWPALLRKLDRVCPDYKQ